MRKPVVFYVNLITLAWIAVGGALGSTMRFALSTAVLRMSGSLFPLGTFVVNLVGCVAFGAIVGMAEHRVVLTPDARAFLLVGIMGGFTTFSSYAYESLALLQDGQFAAASVNIVGQVVAGLAGLWLAFALSR